MSSLPTDDEFGWDNLAEDLGLEPLPEAKAPAPKVEPVSEPMVVHVPTPMPEPEPTAEPEEDSTWGVELLDAEPVKAHHEPIHVIHRDRDSQHHDAVNEFLVEAPPGSDVVLETDSGVRLSIHVPEDATDMAESDDESEESEGTTDGTTGEGTGGKKRRRRRRRRKGPGDKTPEVVESIAGSEIVEEPTELDAPDAGPELVSIAAEPSPFDSSSEDEDEDDDEGAMVSAMDEEFQSQIEAPIMEWGTVVPWTDLIEGLYKPER
jgi:hypothetical protein